MLLWYLSFSFNYGNNSLFQMQILHLSQKSLFLNTDKLLSILEALAKAKCIFKECDHAVLPLN